MERIVGKQAPYFKLSAVKGDGNELTEVKLEDYKNKWLVLFFYPLDFTAVCPTEITAFSSKYDEFLKINADILAVSCDSQYSHQAWIRNGLGAIRFPIASDKTTDLAADYGILIKENGISLRGLFIIDPLGVLKYAVVHDLNVGRSVDETLRVLKALQTGSLCAANWHEGDATL
jgi:Peroxiredoxin